MKFSNYKINENLLVYMQKLVMSVIIFSAFSSCLIYSKPTAEKKVTLPNGWSLTPAGKQIPLGDLPLNIAVSPDKKYAAVTNNGQSTQSIQLIDLASEKLLDTYVIGKSWLGLAFGGKGKNLYASGGNDNRILRFEIQSNKLVCRDTFKLGLPMKDNISPAGLAVDEAGGKLYVVTKDNNSLYIFDLSSKKAIKQLSLEGEGYTCLLSPDRSLLYCTCWGCDKVEVLNTRTAELEGAIPVGDNPNDMAMDGTGDYLFVANSNDNSVSVVDTKNRKVVETLNAALYPTKLSGSTTNSVALSKDNRTLYVANADNNCLAIFDVSNPGNSLSLGFIPVGWYPTCVRVVSDKILVANGKGLSSFANPKGPNPVRKTNKVEYQKGDPKKADDVQYIGGLFIGSLSIIDIPNPNQLTKYTKQVYSNTPFNKKQESFADGMKGNPVPMTVGAQSPIKYVFYVVKENRTYDQILGDLPQGNGDTSLVIFGKNITPNQHAVASRFVLLDNFYVDGEVSADGHNWSMGAYATDFLEKTWQTSYGGRGGGYDAEGTRSVANNKNGFLWDFCKKYGVSYRTYAEFADDSIGNIPSLKGHVCPYYGGWDQSVMDTTRFRLWKRDFDSLLAIGQVPQLSTLRFINDHTQGLKIGKPSPYAQVADNDLAVGMFVDYLSKSPIWNECAVFVVEDDAQNGADHVDAHRSTGYIAGGMVKQGFVDHTPYSTSSFLRTIELILGLPPMSQYDAAAEPLWRCFDVNANHPSFSYLPATADLFEKNTAYNEFQEKSEHFDFSREDAVPDQELNVVIWAACRGLSSQCPAPVHAAFVQKIVEEDGD